MTTKNETLEKIRKEANDNGMTFKEIDSKYNGSQIYGLFNRETGRMLVDHYTLWTAYEDVKSGYFKRLSNELL